MGDVPSLPCLLSHLAWQMQAPDLPSCVEYNLDYLQQQSPPLDSSALSTQLAQTIRQEREGAITPLRDFLDVFDRTAGASMVVRLTVAAQEYLHRTAYLWPFLDDFGRMSIRIMRAFGRNTLANFLRDGLIFWPTQDIVLATDSGCNIAFLWYSRLHVEHNLPMRVFQRGADRCFRESTLDLAQSLLIDVGLYGTLLHRILDQQRCPSSMGAWFFGSRSPFIAGWLNLRTWATILASETHVDLLDSIRLVDTIESLLKPCTLVANHLRLTDPVSFICAATFLWAQRRFSQEQQHRRTSQPVDLSLDAVKTSASAWFVANPAPRWEEAETFIRGWIYRPLCPMDRLCGLNV